MPAYPLRVEDVQIGAGDNYAAWQRKLLCVCFVVLLLAQKSFVQKRRNEIFPFSDFNVTSFVYFPSKWKIFFSGASARLPFSLSAPESNA